MKHSLLPSILLACLLGALLQGCSDDNAGTADAPNLPPADHGVWIKDTYIPTPDGRPLKTDVGVPKVDMQLPPGDPCDPSCRAEQVALCVKDPAQGGSCVQCLQDAHCSGNPDAEGPYCNTATKKCVECLEASHCATHPSGAVCDTGTCVCLGDSDCTGAPRSGVKCVQLLSYKRCGCEDVSHCAGTPLGKICFTELNHKCVCQTNAECAGNADRTACQKPYYYAEYGQCEIPCRSDSVCLKERMRHCKMDTGFCVECTDNAHCAGVERGQRCMPDQSCGCQTKADCKAGEECGQDLTGAMRCFTPE